MSKNKFVIYLSIFLSIFCLVALSMRQTVSTEQNLQVIPKIHPTTTSQNALRPLSKPARAVVTKNTTTTTPEPIYEPEITVPETTLPPETVPPTQPAPSEPTSSLCGGDLPPCYVMQRESGGNPNAVNPTGCGGNGCYGLYQFDPRTWNAVASSMGRQDLVGNYLPSAAEQAAVARHLWAGGSGCSHWAAC